MNTVDKLIIENIKRARKIELTLDGEISLTLKPSKKLYHDIALAYQSACVNLREEK